MISIRTTVCIYLTIVTIKRRRKLIFGVLAKFAIFNFFRRTNLTLCRYLFIYFVI